jgi:hypothetical protein
MSSVFIRGVLSCIVFATLPCGASDQAATREINLLIPTVIAFAPNALKDGDATLADALVLAEACLGQGAIDYQVVRADRIVVHDGGREVAFDLAGLVPLPGALFLTPGAHPSIVFAGGGLESMATLLPRAAGGYFHIPCS